jgi:hypothetical protein
MNIPKTVDFNEKILASTNFVEAIFMHLADGMIVSEVDPQHWSDKKFKDIWMCNIWCPDCKMSQSIFTPYLNNQKIIDLFLLRVQGQHSVFKTKYCKCKKPSI